MKSSVANLMSLRSKLIICFTLIMLSVSSIIIVSTLNTTYQHSEKQLLQRFEVSKRVLLYKLRNDARIILNQLNTIATSHTTRALVNNIDKNQQILGRWLLNQQHGSSSDTDFILAFDANHQLIIGSHRIELNSLPSYFNNDKVNIVSQESQWYLVKSVPVFTRANEDQASAWIVIGHNLTKLISRDMRDLTGFSTLISEQKAYDERQAALKNAYPTEHDIPNKTSPWTTQVVDGRRIIFYKFSSPDAPRFYFSFLIDENSAYLNFSKLSSQLILALNISLILGLITAYYFYRSITDPLQNLVSVAQQIRSGNYKNKMPSNDTTEIQELSHAIESMQENIASRETEIYNLAYYSSLTKIPNRIYLMKQLEDFIKDHTCRTIAVIIVDMDGFKEINDTLGHEFGDKLIGAVAHRLDSITTTNSLCAHLGADEFAVLIPNVKQSELATSVNQYCAVFKEPFLVNEVHLSINASSGISLYPEHATEANQLMQYADIALNDCKSKVLSHVTYSDELNNLSLFKLNLMTELRQAIEQDQLVLYYQPKLCLKTNKIKSFETLVRWIHPEHGFIPPDDFIPLAERSGTIIELTQWVITKSITQLRAWLDEDLQMSLSVNISALDLVDSKISNFISEKLADANVESERLTIEVTESAVMSDPQQAVKTLKMLKRMGMSISIDDFGTGYSSIAQLKQMPVSELKIDKSFVLELSRNDEDKKIVKSVANLAHNLGLTVVAEGVEDEFSLEFLRTIGVENAQGYYIAKPMNLMGVKEWMKNFKLSSAKQITHDINVIKNTGT